MSNFNLTNVILERTYAALENGMVRQAEPPEPKPVSRCAGCGLAFDKGDEALRYEDEDYCDSSCLARGLGARLIYL